MEHDNDTQVTTEGSQNGAAPPPVEEPAEERSDRRVKKWNVYVHAGDGAQDCPDGESGKCVNNGHWHMFCRLPNPLQIESIREKADAAKARVIRQSRDPESDRYIVLETDMETLRGIGNKEDLVAEILGRTRYTEHVKAVREVADREEFETIEDDQRRFTGLESMSEEERPKDEYEELVRHLEKWTSEIDKERERRQKPEKETLEAKTEDDLIEIIREERVKVMAQEAWMQTYSLWEWYIGTLKTRDPEKGFPCDRMFGDLEHMKSQPPEVVEAIQTAFEMLESGDFGAQSQNAPRAEGNS